MPKQNFEARKAGEPRDREQSMTEVGQPKEEKNFRIPVSNGIFRHYRRLRDGLWLFLWYIDRTTKEVDEEDGSRVGLVLGGRPVRDCDIARDFDCSPRTARSWRQRLVEGNYIRQTRTPIGYRVEVLRSKKWRPKAIEDSGSDGEKPTDQNGKDSPTGKNLPIGNDRGVDCAIVADPIKTEQDTTLVGGKVGREEAGRPSKKDPDQNPLERIVCLMHASYAKAGLDPLTITNDQRTTLGDLLSNYGEDAVMDAWQNFLDRPNGVEGLVVPFALFLRDFEAYREAAAECRKVLGAPSQVAFGRAIERSEHPMRDRR